MLRWLVGINLGFAVVPDVCRMKAGASGSGSSGSPGGAARADGGASMLTPGPPSWDRNHFQDLDAQATSHAPDDRVSLEEKDGVRSKVGKAGFDFTKRLPGIEGDAHGGTGDGGNRQSSLRAVRHGDRDPRSSAQSCRAQRGAEFAKQNLQIAVGEGSKAGRNDRGLIRLHLCAQLDCGAERGRFRRSSAAVSKIGSLSRASNVS